MTSLGAAPAAPAVPTGGTAFLPADPVRRASAATALERLRAGETELVRDLLAPAPGSALFSRLLPSARTVARPPSSLSGASRRGSPGATLPSACLSASPGHSLRNV